MIQVIAIKQNPIRRDLCYITFNWMNQCNWNPDWSNFYIRFCVYYSVMRESLVVPEIPLDLSY